MSEKRWEEEKLRHLPCSRAARSSSGRGEGGDAGGRREAGSPGPRPRPADPAAHRSENNFQPAAWAGPAPVSGAAVAPRDDHREILEEHALQILRAHRFPPRVSLWRKERERDLGSRRCSAPSTTKPPWNGTATQFSAGGKKQDFTSCFQGII